MVSLRRPLVPLAVALAACGGDSGAPDRAVVAATSLDTLAFVRRDVRVGEGCRPGAAAGDADQVEVAPCVTVELVFPDSIRAAVPALGDSVRAFVRRSALTLPYDSVPAANGDAAAAAFIGAYRTAYAAAPHPSQVWSWTQTVELACNTPHLVGLRGEGGAYMGGAHPSAWTTLASYDARTGRRLDAAALFVPDSLPAVTAAAERAFRRAREIPAGQSLADAGFTFFEGGRFALPADVLACPDSVTFNFDAYEVGPYALGPTTFGLPVAEVRAWLREDVPIGRQEQ